MTSEPLAAIDRPKSAGRLRHRIAVALQDPRP